MTSTKPLVSVIVCNYNGEAFLAEAVRSVVEQAYDNIEILLVDDGSTDASRDIIEAFDDARITRIFKANGGQASAFNAGISRAKGEIIAFLDSDDLWTREKLDTLVNFDHAARGHYSVMQHLVSVMSGGDKYAYKDILPSGDCFLRMKKGELDFFVPTSGLAFRRHILERVYPIPEQLMICADAFMTRAVLPYGPVLSVPVVLSYYRQHSNNAVFQNASFDGRALLRTVICPSLNRFFEMQRIDCRVAYPEATPAWRKIARRIFRRKPSK